MQQELKCPQCGTDIREQLEYQEELDNCCWEYLDFCNALAAMYTDIGGEG